MTASLRLPFSFRSITSFVVAVAVVVSGLTLPASASSYEYDLDYSRVGEPGDPYLGIFTISAVSPGDSVTVSMYGNPVGSCVVASGASSCAASFDLYNDVDFGWAATVSGTVKTGTFHLKYSGNDKAAVAPADPSAPPPVCDRSCGFADVAPDSIFLPSITWMSDAGVTRGCDPDGTQFCPSEFVTRGQMAAFLNRAFRFAPAPAAGFSDTAGSVFSSDIDAVAAAGVTLGCDTARFCPDELVTRGQMAAFIYRSAGLSPTGIDAFEDDATSGFETEIDTLASIGITAGCNPEGSWFCPGAPVTREQMAAFLARTLGGVNRVR